MGRVTTNLLSELGYKIVAVSEKGAFYDPNRLDITKVEWLKNQGSILDCGSDYQIDPRALLELDVDILVPAALANAIHSG